MQALFEYDSYNGDFVLKRDKNGIIFNQVQEQIKILNDHRKDKSEHLNALVEMFDLLGISMSKDALNRLYFDENGSFIPNSFITDFIGKKGKSSGVESL